MLVFEQGMQQKLSDSWKNVYNSEISGMAEDGLDNPRSIGGDISGDRKSLVDGLLKRANGFSDVMGSGGLEQKIQELRAEKEAAEFKKYPDVSETDDQDSPIDFSVKRRSSFSGSLTDDSMASSTSPNPMGDYANNGSPPLADRDLHRHSYDNVSVKREHGERDQSFTNGHCVNGSSSPGSVEDVKPFRTDNPSSLMPPGTSIPPLINGLGMFSGLPSNLLANGSAMNAFSQLAASAAYMDPRNKKANRPFKAYPKEALQMPLGFFGLPGMTPAMLQQGLESGLFGGANGEEVTNLYNQQLQLLREKQLSAEHSGKRSPPTHPPAGHRSPSHNHIRSQQQHQQISSSHPQALNNHRLSSSPSSQTHEDHPNHHAKSSPMSNGGQCAPSSTSANPPVFPLPTVLPPTSTHCPSSNSSGTTLVSSTSPSYSSFNSRKRPRILPEEQKDAAYWERRRKNNDAAKRSRDARRAKEDEIAIRAALLEQENLKLRVEVAALKTETARLRCLLYNS